MPSLKYTPCVWLQFTLLTDHRYYSKAATVAKLFQSTHSTPPAEIRTPPAILGSPSYGNNGEAVTLSSPAVTCVIAFLRVICPPTP